MIKDEKAKMSITSTEMNKEGESKKKAKKIKTIN